MKRSRHTLKPLPSLAMLLPPAARLAAHGGPAGVMRTEWRDPDDVSPNAARTAKTVTGYRTYCPLRRYRERQGSSAAITEKHVLAADELRKLADAVLIGFGGRRDLVTVQSLVYGPRSGPTVAALRQAHAWRPYRRAMALFCQDQKKLIAHVILLNWTVRRWTEQLRESGRPADAKVELGRLASILDVLAEHFRSEVDQELQHSVNA
jgi:hypothetical protein